MSTATKIRRLAKSYWFYHMAKMLNFHWLFKLFFYSIWKAYYSHFPAKVSIFRLVSIISMFTLSHTIYSRKSLVMWSKVDHFFICKNPQNPHFRGYIFPRRNTPKFIMVTSYSALIGRAVTHWNPRYQKIKEL